MNDDAHNRVAHDMLSEMLELFCCHDQVDVTNLMGMEALCRHMQFIENEVRRKTEARKPYDNAEFYLGRPKKTGGALVSPDLLKWVTERASREGAILKEQRKAAEERALVREKPPNK